MIDLAFYARQKEQRRQLDKQAIDAMTRDEKMMTLALRNTMDFVNLSPKEKEIGQKMLHCTFASGRRSDVFSIVLSKFPCLIKMLAEMLGQVHSQNHGFFFMLPRCVTCGVHETKASLFACQGCHVRRYCSLACQRNDRERCHRLFCKEGAARLDECANKIRKGIFSRVHIESVLSIVWHEHMLDLAERAVDMMRDQVYDVTGLVIPMARDENKSIDWDVVAPHRVSNIDCDGDVKELKDHLMRRIILTSSLNRRLHSLTDTFPVEEPTLEKYYEAGRCFKECPEQITTVEDWNRVLPEIDADGNFVDPSVPDSEDPAHSAFDEEYRELCHRMSKAEPPAASARGAVDECDDLDDDDLEREFGNIFALQASATVPEIE